MSSSVADSGMSDVQVVGIAIQYGISWSIARAPDGTPVNAVRGLLDFISRLTGEYSPTHLVCCWDNDWRPQWRVDLIPSYKAHRVEAVVPGGSDVEEVPDPLEAQIPVIVAVLEAFGIAIVGADDYEADDVIGTLARQGVDAGVNVVIVWYGGWLNIAGRATVGEAMRISNQADD